MTFRLPFSRFSRVSKRCLFAAIVAAGVGQASGELWLYEGFDYTPETALQHVGIDESSFGFTGLWSSGELNSGHEDVIGSTGLSYGSLLTRGLSLRSFTPASDAAHSNSENSRSVDPSSITIPTEGAATIWVSFLLQRNSAIMNAPASDFATISLGDVSIGELDGFDALGIHQRTGLSPSTVSLGVGVTNLIVLKLELNTGGMVRDQFLDQGSLFVNPLIGQPDPGVDPVVQMWVNIPKLTSIMISSGYRDTEFIFDELRIGSTYESVTPVVPEPTSLLLLGTAGAVLIGSRRRRK